MLLNHPGQNAAVELAPIGALAAAHEAQMPAGLGD